MPRERESLSNNPRLTTRMPFERILGLRSHTRGSRIAIWTWALFDWCPRRRPIGMAAKPSTRLCNLTKRSVRLMPRSDISIGNIGDWQTAEREFRYAVDLNPNYIEGHQSLVWYLAWSGRPRDALAEVEKIRRLDPVYPFTFLDESGVYYHQRDYQSLVEAGQKSVAANPGNWSSHYLLAVGYEGSRRLAEAVLEYQRAVELSQRDLDATAGL